MFSLYSVVCEAGAYAMFGAAVAGVPPDDGRRGGTGVVVDAGPVDGTDAGVRQPPAARDAVVGASPQKPVAWTPSPDGIVTYHGGCAVTQLTCLDWPIRPAIPRLRRKTHSPDE